MLQKGLECSIGMAKYCFPFSTENVKKIPVFKRQLPCQVGNMVGRQHVFSYLSNVIVRFLDPVVDLHVRRVERAIFLLCPFSNLELEFTFYFLVVDVDGMWGEWGDWSSCSVQFSCQRGGIRRRFVALETTKNY